MLFYHLFDCAYNEFLFQLIVDECVDLGVLGSVKNDQLGRSVFDALLHLLTTPQSSVTLLRTLGGESVDVFLGFLVHEESDISNPRPVL